MNILPLIKVIFINSAQIKIKYDTFIKTVNERKNELRKVK